MNPNSPIKQQEWYENWHSEEKPDLPVEDLKQQMRLEGIQQALGHIHPKTVLVVGCGRGKELALLVAEQIVAFDLSVNAAQHARKILSQPFYLQADAMRLPFRDQYFDFVLSSEVIEHIPQPQQMLQEIQRVLKPGGQVLITTPNWQSFFGLSRYLGEKILRRPITSDDQPVDHWYTSRELRDLLTLAGLDTTLRLGAWYFPPTGLGMKRLPDRFMAAMFRLFLPVERLLKVVLPDWGHMLLIMAQRPNK